MPVTASDVVSRVPERIGRWVCGMTELAVDLLTEIAGEDPEYGRAA